MLMKYVSSKFLISVCIFLDDSRYFPHFGGLHTLLLNTGSSCLIYSSCESSMIFFRKYEICCSDLPLHLTVGIKLTWVISCLLIMNEFEAQLSEIPVWIARNFTRRMHKRQLKRQKQISSRFMLFFLSIVMASCSLNLCDQLKFFIKTFKQHTLAVTWLLRLN